MSDIHSNFEQTLESETLSHADTHIVLHNAPAVVPQTVDPTPSIRLSDPLDVCVRQDYPIHGFTWASANIKGAVLLNSRPINTFINIPSIRDRINNRKGLKGTFELTIKVNSPGSAYGAIMFELYPSAFTNPRSSYVDVHTYTPYQLTETAIFDASNPKDIVFKLGPHHIEPYMDLTANGGKHWRLYCTVIAPLRNSVNTTSLSCAVRVYCRAIEHSFVGLVPEMISTTLKSMSKTISDKGESYFGKTKEFASTLTQAAGELADLFGYSKPILHHTILSQPVKNRVLTTDAPDPAEVVSLFSYNHVSPIPREDVDEDPLSFDSITNHETLVWRGTLTDGTVVRVPVCPGNYPTNASGPSGRIMTCDMFCLLPFTYYRVEQFIYTLRIFSSPNVRGDLYLFYLPNVDMTDVYNTSWEVNTKKMIISLQGSSCTEVVVNWNANSRVLPLIPVTTGSAAPTDTTTPSNGCLFLYPGTITSPNGAISLDIDITYRSKGLQAMVLNDNFYDSSTRAFGDITAPSTVVTESKFTDLSLCTKTIINQEDPYDIYDNLSGDPIRSMRVLMQRPSLHESASFYFTEIDQTPGNFCLNRFPLPRNANAPITYESNAADVDVTSYTTYAAYVTSAFVGFRGSTRHTVRSHETLLTIKGSDLGINVDGVMKWRPRMYMEMSSSFTGGPKPKTGEVMDWRTGAYTTVSQDHDPRVSFPYNQVFHYYPSCWAKTGADIEFDYFSIKPWTVIYMDMAMVFPDTITNAQCFAEVDFEVYSSMGNDASVFMWRGVPLYA